MGKIKLNLSQDIFTPKFFPTLFDYSKRWFVMNGSAGSGKSYFIAQRIIVRCCKEKIKILVCRRTGATLRNSTFSLFKEILADWGLTPYVKIRESDMCITFPNGSQIIHAGLDSETKLLSLNDISTIWVEEAFEVPKEIVEQLNLRMRGRAAGQQIILSFNPISTHNWLYTFVNNLPESALYIHSTFKDNPFLSDEYVNSLNELYKSNPQKARIYCDGEFGIDAEGLVFPNFKVEKIDMSKVIDLPHHLGIDLGYRDPTAIVESYYDNEHKIIYITKEFYKRGCQLDEVVSAYKKMELGKDKVYVDSAEPRSIDFLRNNGINAEGSKKGPDSVRAGYAFIQNYLVIIDSSCENVIKEFSNFSYKKNRNGEYTEDTTHEFSHSIDALRYAYSHIYTNRKIKTLDKALLGL